MKTEGEFIVLGAILRFLGFRGARPGGQRTNFPVTKLNIAHFSRKCGNSEIREVMFSG